MAVPSAEERFPIVNLSAKPPSYASVHYLQDTKNPMLKEQLLDTSEVEIPAVASSLPEEGATKLEDDIRKLNLEYPDETREERALRLSIQDRIDRVVIVGHGVVVAATVISCAICMLFFDTVVTEVLFTISFLLGPFILYQRLQLIKTRSRREIVAMLWSETRSLTQSNIQLEADISKMNADVQRLNSSTGRYKSMIEGYDLDGVTELYHENERLNYQKKMLAEAIGIVELTKSILSTDINSDHHVGDAELSLLSHRVEAIEGVPFSSEELCDRFKKEEVRNLRTLADVVRRLYIEKRREQVSLREAELLDKSPRNLGTPYLWKRKISAIGVSV